MIYTFSDIPNKICRKLQFRLRNLQDMKTSEKLKITLIIACISIFGALLYFGIRKKESNYRLHPLLDSVQHFSRKSPLTVVFEEEDAYWDRETTLDSKQTIILKWNFTEEYITLMIIAKTNGSVYLGFRYSEIEEFDVVFGDAHLTKDYHSNGNQSFILDDSQDYEFQMGKSNKTHIMFICRRKIDTCDKFDIKFSMNTINIFWGITGEEVHTLPSMQLKNYNFLGRMKTSLLYRTNPKPEGEYIYHYDLTVNNIRLSSPAATEYWCHLRKIPNFGRQHHLLGFEKLVTDQSEPIIHHLLASICFFDFPIKEGSFYCYEFGSLSIINYCTNMFGGFALGSNKDFFYPSDIGITFGSTETRTMYVLMEVHYGLPRKKFAVNDNSGLRLYHTDKLRTFNSSFFKVGIQHFQIIPPKQKEFSNIAVCASECLKNSVPSDGFYIFAYLFHSHHRAKKMRLHHIRNGIEISRISDDHYDFHLQDFRTIEKVIHVLPNDILVMNCIFDSTNESSTTLYGLDTEHEMCEVYLQTYPSVQLFKCISNLKIEYLASEFPDIPNFEKLSNLLSLHSKLDIINTYFVKLNLTIEQTNRLRNMYFHGTHDVQCLRTNGNLLMQYDFDSFIPLKEESTGCQK